MSEFPDMAFPLVYAGTIVKRLLAEAAMAESDGDTSKAEVLFSRALIIDNAR